MKKGVTIELLQSKNREKWDKFINQHSGGRFAHLAVYKDILEKTYGYKGRFLYILEQGEILGVFPFFELKSLFKKRFVSQPFNDYGGILFREGLSEGQKKGIILMLEAYLRKLFSNQENLYIEVHGQRDELDFFSRDLVSKFLCKFAFLKLDSYNEVYNNFDRQIKKALKKAEKEKVVVYEDTSLGSIKNQFYPLYAKYSKNRHGTPPHSLNFFLNCYHYSPKNIKIFFAQVDNCVVAALWGFLTDQGIQITYNPSLKKYLPKRPNDLLHAEFIEWACKNKFKYFDFGPARYTNQIYFKKKWGVKFLDHLYFYFSDKPVNKKPYMAEAKPVKLLAFIWKYFVPNPIAKLIGPFIRKKIGK